MSKKRILLVDDEHEFVDLVKTRLESNNYEVIVAYNGNEALDKAQSEKPDLILLDILMPEKDGYNALKELKQIETTKNVPVLVVTAKAGMRDLFEVEGIADYIVKPFEAEDLLLRMKRALGS